MPEHTSCRVTRGLSARRYSAAVVLALIPLVASADYLNFLSTSPWAYFKENDYDLMKKNVHDVLDSTAPHAKGQWSNPKTGSSGFAEVRGEFINTDAALCKRLRVVNEAGGRKGDATYAVCKYEGRGWLLHPDAVPAKPAPENPIPENK